MTGNDAVAEGRVSASGSDGNHEGDVLESDDKGDHANSYDLEVKVADFGLSVFVNRGEKSKAVGGSTSYMSPEVRARVLLESDVSVVLVASSDFFYSHFSQ